MSEGNLLIKREKRRYFALKVECVNPPNEQKVLAAIKASILTLFGEYGASQAKITLIDYLPDKYQLIIRCSHSMLQQVRTAITSIIELNGENVAIHVLDTSGTLKALSRKTKKRGVLA